MYILFTILFFIIISVFLIYLGKAGNINTQDDEYFIAHDKNNEGII